MDSDKNGTRRGESGAYESAGGIGGILYTVSVDTNDRARGKKVLQYAAGGLLTVILAYAAVMNLISILYRATT